MRDAALRVRRATAGLLALLVFLVTTVAPAAETDWARLAADLDVLREGNGVPAMGLVVIDGSQPVLIQGLGTATGETPFRWGSITKSFTALAALALMREHGLDPDLPVRQLLGPCCYSNPWAETHPVRFLQLLELSAGFADLRRTEFDDNTPRTLAEALARGAAERRTYWPPGLQHSYSNVPPGLTAAVIERVSGQPFERYLRRRVLEPLGMRSASLAPVPGLPGGHRADGHTPIGYWNMTFAGFGALNAPIAEMSRYVTALLNDGRLDGRQALPAPLIHSLFEARTTPAARQGLAVTYAAGIYARVRKGHVFWGHGGDADGYLSRYGVLRESGRGYVVVINTDNPPLMERLVRRIEGALVADLPRSVPEPVEDPEISSYVGTYYQSSSRFAMERWSKGDGRRIGVHRHADGLLVQRGEQQTYLAPLGGGRFRRAADPTATVVFVRSKDGALYLFGELGNYVNLSNTACPAFLGLCE